MRITDDALCKAAIEAQDYLLAQLPAEEYCHHAFSPEFEQQINYLLRRIKQNAIVQRTAVRSWKSRFHYGLVGILLCFLFFGFVQTKQVIAFWECVIGQDILLSESILSATCLLLFLIILQSVLVSRENKKWGVILPLLFGLIGMVDTVRGMAAIVSITGFFPAVLFVFVAAQIPTAILVAIYYLYHS